MKNNKILIAVLALAVLGGIIYFGMTSPRPALTPTPQPEAGSPPAETPTPIPTLQSGRTDVPGYPELSVRLDKRAVKVGETVTADIMLDSGANAVIAVSAHLTYDPVLLSAEKVEAGENPGSPLTLVANRSINAGRVEIDVAEFLPGVSGFGVFVGRVQFKALRAGTVNITFDFAGPGQGSSAVVSADGSMIDVLAAIHGAELTITE